MNITHVVPHIDQEASGPSYSVPRLCQSIAACNNAVELKCLAALGPISGVELSVYKQWPLLGHFAISSDMTRALRQRAREPGIVHNHSLWSMVNVASGCVVPGHRAKLVTSPRGTLAEWALQRNRHLKRLLWLLQKRALQRADLLHATCDQELQEIRSLGLRAPVVLIPNGIDVPDLAGDEPTARRKTLLFLSRIHPKKGIDELLRAWQALEPVHPEWRLVIAGTGEARHEQHVKELAGVLELQRVEFPGPVYGAEKSATYCAADLFVLPTHAENFGLVVAEALAHGCPAIVTRGAPWSGLVAERCGWWIERDPLRLTETLRQAMAMRGDELASMGRRGRAWMRRDFSWESIGCRMNRAYRWLVHGGEPPADIHLYDDHTVSYESGYYEARRTGEIDR